MTLERPGFRLTAEAENDSADFEREYGSINGCRCHLCPPCSYCTHPGNPANLEEDDSAWEPDPEEDNHIVKIEVAVVGKNTLLQMAAALMAAGGIQGPYTLEMEMGRLEGARFIEHLVEETASRLPKPKIRIPKEPNPEIQSAAETKRQRRLERNRRLAK